MPIIMLISMLLITIGGLVTLLTMCAGLLSSAPMREGAVPELTTHDCEEVSASLQQG